MSPLLLYTVKQNGVIVGNGSYQTEELLRIDYPEPEYELILGVAMDLPEPVLDYAAMRRKEYPSQGDFADAMYWMKEGNPEPYNVYMQKVAAVKQKYPKLKLD